MTLEFRFDEIKSDEPRQTTCAFGVVLHGEVIWPVRGVGDAALEIQIDDFLAHIAEFWKPLMLRQTYPLALNPPRPSQLRTQADAWLAALPEAVAEIDDEIVESFQECHDFSRCFAGYFELPPLWLLRSGEEMLIDTGECFASVPFDIAKSALQTAGDWIANRLHDHRWADLTAGWRNRDEGDVIRLLEWSTSLDATTVSQLAEDGLLDRPRTVSEAANDDSELRLAARMASALQSEDVRAVLERVIKFPKTDAPELDELSKRARLFLMTELPRARPFEQSEGVAAFVRQVFEIAQDSPVEVFDLVRSLGVQICPEDFDLPSLDALAVWGGAARASHPPQCRKRTTRNPRA